MTLQAGLMLSPVTPSTTIGTIFLVILGIANCFMVILPLFVVVTIGVKLLAPEQQRCILVAIGWFDAGETDDTPASPTSSAIEPPNLIDKDAADRDSMFVTEDNYSSPLPPTIEIELSSSAPTSMIPIVANIDDRDALLLRMEQNTLWSDTVFRENGSERSSPI